VEEQVGEPQCTWVISRCWSRRDWQLPARRSRWSAAFGKLPEKIAAGGHTFGCADLSRLRSTTPGAKMFVETRRPHSAREVAVASSPDSLKVKSRERRRTAAPAQGQRENG
jgi:hypothetical protein